MKTIKIADQIHRELKIFVAVNHGEKITDFSGLAIMKELKSRGHKFTTPEKIKSKK